ncbi:General amino acid permease AGP3 [Cytospora mali]|uniref:General amino acid permease AGP3 n=1 Tax=Cytospora mali TaxID=578113 RepID=A0A194VAM4_CYTMA|nr:General amino acid permease AGP3 [Valsa mali var. pyri (nom. inval.)]
MSRSSQDQPPPFPGTTDITGAGGKELDVEKTDAVDVQEGIIIEDGLRRALKGRHVSLISLASVIGASCFYGFGYALYLSGPVGALIGFGIVGFMVWALMQSIGEVTTMFPIAGGFIEYWVPEEKFPLWGWILVFWVFFSCLTTLGVHIYGELEFYLGWFKIGALALCFFLSFLYNVGAFGTGYIGFRYWGAPYGPILHGIEGFGQVFVLASAYYVGTEIISLAAGETKDPRRAIPQGVNTVVYRILFVYMGLIFFQGIICPSNSPDLLNAHSTTASSPFTIAFTAGGWTWSADFINAIIVVAFISAVNGCIYVQSRALYSLALSGRAPKVFATTSKKGVPYVSILTSCLWGFLALMNLKVTAGQVFSYMTSVGGSAAYIAWAGIILTHLRVRSGMEKQGIDQSTYPFRAFGSIWIYRFNLFLNLFILFIQGFTAFESPFNWRSFIASYIMIPTSVVFFLGYKWYHNTRWVRLSEMDFSDRLVKDDSEDEKKKESRVARLVDRFRN